MDIILFQIARLENNSCQLKDFLYFLNWSRAKRPLTFSYIPRYPLLHLDMTLKENILLESVPCSLTTTKEYQLKTSLDKTGNEYLWQLFKQIPNLDVYPSEVDPMAHKIIALIKALLRPVDYLLLENPQEGFDSSLLEMLVEALKFQAQDLKKMVLIYGPEDLWGPHCNKKITQAQSGYAVRPMMDMGTAEKQNDKENQVLKFHHFPSKNKVA